MTLHLRAHFDGKVIVPDEPLDVPVNQPLEVQVVVTDVRGGSSISQLAALRRIAQRATAGVNLPPEALSRESIYDDTP